MKTIKIYTIDHCPYCTELKELLIKENIDFIEVNVNLPENEDEYNRINEITKNNEVPIIKIGRQLLIPNVSFKSIKEAAETTKKLLN